MEKTDILTAIQEKLIQDLGFVVNNVERDYKPKLNNSWVFKYIGNFIQQLKPAKVDDVSYSRKDVENTIKKSIDENLPKIQNHVPEIKTSDAYSLIPVAGNLYNLISSRADNELTSLESKAANYERSKELINSEFDNSNAFLSKNDHREWVESVSDNLGVVFDYIQNLGNTLSKKKGLSWKIKLKAAKIYLKSKLNIKLNLGELAEDIAVVKDAVISAFQEYEELSIAKRNYSS